MKFLLTSATALAVIIASGVVHGISSGRWGTSKSLAEAAGRLDSVPMQIGSSWVAETLPEIPARQLEQAEASNYLARRYINNELATAVNVLILCGRSGPIATHPPTVCFTGTGFFPETPPVRRSPSSEDGSSAGEFWHCDFSKDSEGIRTTVRTFWGWNATGPWQAPDNPRIDFAPYQHLYKMYVTRPVTPNEELAANDACLEFLRAFVPEIEKVLLAAQ